MKRNAIIKKFSEILYQASESSNSLEDVNKSLSAFENFVNSNKVLNSILQSKRLSYDQKIDILNSALGQHIHPLVLGIACYIETPNVGKIMRSIRVSFNKKYMIVKNKLSVHAIVADELDAQNISKMKEDLDIVLNKDTDLTLEVDASIIGGIKLRIENRFIDASIKNQINNLKVDLMKI